MPRSLMISARTRRCVDAICQDYGMDKPLGFTKIVNVGQLLVTLHRKVSIAMIVTFNEEYLYELYSSGKSDKKHRFQPQIVRKYIRVIDLMISEENVQGLWKYNSLNYERLDGDKQGLSSVRVND